MTTWLRTPPPPLPPRLRTLLATAFTAAALALPGPALPGIETAGAAGPRPAAAQEPVPFTLEDILSAPFPSDLTASPTGDRVAWVRNDRGVRNIWVARAPDWRGRPVTDYTGDLGVVPAGLVFTPDGQRLLYGVGGSPNRRDEHPNPASLPRGPELALYMIDLATGEEVRLSGGQEIAIAPDGSRYLIVRGGEVLVKPLHPDTAAELLFRPRAGVRELRWSPDGRRVAFVSPRGDHSFVGVYDLDDDAITWMAPALDHDRSPVWSPDGARLAFLRIPDDPHALPFFARPAHLPWAILVADPLTGEAVELWRADEGAGSVFQGVVGPALLWARDRLVFPWEKGGWLRIWSIAAPPTDGSLAAGPGAARGVATPLTPGEHEVQWLTLAADSTTLLVSSNQGDPHRRHVWRVPADGSEPPRPVTEGAGIEWAPVSPGEGVVAYLASGPTTPARAEVRVHGDRSLLAPEAPPSSFPSEHLVVPAPVVFPADDGMRIPGQLFAPPPRCGDGPHPGLLFFHGGSRRQMLLGFHTRGYYHNAYAFNQYMANQCFVVLAVNYRSGIGYGLEFREAEKYGAGGASELNDVLGAARWLGARPDVDANRIGLWGGSYGGYLTALGLARAPELFAAGVDLHGVHDWNAAIANFSDFDPAERPEIAATALASSPMADLSQWDDPILLIHGDDDRNVPFGESVRLAEALRTRDVAGEVDATGEVDAAGGVEVEVEVLVFPDEVHGFLRHASWLAAYRAAADFLVRHLGGVGPERDQQFLQTDPERGEAGAPGSARAPQAP